MFTPCANLRIACSSCLLSVPLLRGVCLIIRGWINLLPSIRVRSRQNQEPSIFLLDQLVIGSQFSELFGKANSKSWCSLSSTRVGRFYTNNPKSSETTLNWNKSRSPGSWLEWFLEPERKPVPQLGISGFFFLVTGFPHFLAGFLSHFIYSYFMH